MRTMSNLTGKIIKAPLFLVAVVAFSAITMLLWNALMPELFKLPLLNFWQAAGLLILARLLFGGARPHISWHGSPLKLRDKLSKMTPEEKRDFFRKMHAYRYGHYDDFFKEEHKPEE